MSFDLDTRSLLVGGMVVTRTLTFLMSMPVLGMRGVPRPVRISLAIWLAIAVLPGVMAHDPLVPTGPVDLARALCMEILVGMMMAFGVVTLFAAVQFAGQLISIQMGMAMVNVIDPTTDMQVSVLSQIYNLLTVLVFLAIDGHLVALHALADSFALLVPGRFVPGTEGLLETVSQMGALYAFALRLAMPVIITLLLVSLSLGLVGRTVPQLNILVLGFPIKILVGCFVLAASIPFFADVMGELLLDLPDRLGRIVLASALGR